MDRRDAVKYISALLGGSMVGSTYFLTGCRNEEVPVSLVFSEKDIPLLDEIADTILPETSTPGAKAAGVGAFMVVMVNDAYEKADQEAFHQGLMTLNQRARKDYGKDFVNMNPEQRLEMLTALDQEQRDYQENRAPGEPSHYFRMMKELTLLGYFTSEIGCTQAMRYVETPGRYDSCVPYEKGEKAWAS